MNPLIPEATDVLWAAAFVLNLVLVIAALVSLLRADDRRRWLTHLLLIVLVPFVGPVVSLLATRRHRATPVTPRA